MIYYETLNLLKEFYKLHKKKTTITERGKEVNQRNEEQGSNGSRLVFLATLISCLLRGKKLVLFNKRTNFVMCMPLRYESTNSIG